MNIFRKFLDQPWSGGIVVGMLATMLVAATIDPSGSYPGIGEGPGLTVDEVFNAQQGYLLVEIYREYGVWAFDPAIAKDIFQDGGETSYLADHPPVGRLFLGLVHHAIWSILSPESPAGVSVTACARFGSAILFGFTVFLIGATAGTWFGRSAGWFAAISVLLMPRVFAHAHLASLETCVGFTYCLAVLCLANSWSWNTKKTSDKQPEASSKISWKQILFPGLMLGLAMLTKIQGFLVIPPVILWALWYGRQKAILPLAIWGAVGGIVFFLGWSWLWADPVAHFFQFLGSATDRVSLNVWYFGKKYADIETPWHYPWVMFTTTVPLGLHLLGGIGAGRIIQDRCKDSRMILVLLCILFPLVLFSTHVAVYDGARLFLMVFPLWALFIGKGGKLAWEWLREKKSPKFATIACTLFFLFQSWGIISMHPVQLSYYNLLTGGLRGADAIGMERTYWSDSVTRSFLQQCTEHIPPNSTIQIVPILHQFQVQEMNTQSPIIRKQGWNLVPFGTTDALTKEKQYVIVFYRQADLPETFQAFSRKGQNLRPIVEAQKQGVRLAALFKLNSP